jgi:hypothetical protein
MFSLARLLGRPAASVAAQRRPYAGDPNWMLSLLCRLWAGGGADLRMSGRKCLAIEISPAYVHLCIQRWQDFTAPIQQ